MPTSSESTRLNGSSSQLFPCDDILYRCRRESHARVRYSGITRLNSHRTLLVRPPLESLPRFSRFGESIAGSFEWVVVMVVDDLRIRRATVDDGASIWDLRNAAIRADCVGYYAIDAFLAAAVGVSSFGLLFGQPKRSLPLVILAMIAMAGFLLTPS